MCAPSEWLLYSSCINNDNNNSSSSSRPIKSNANVSVPSEDGVKTCCPLHSPPDLYYTLLSAGDQRRGGGCFFPSFLPPLLCPQFSSITCLLNTVFSAAVCWLAATRYDQLILFDHELQSSYTRFASASAVAAASAAAAAFRCRLSFIVARTREEVREKRDELRLN